jgi:hypothetical protein
MHKERTGKVDGNPSWSFNAQSGLHLCFSCGYKGSSLTLVVDMLGLTNSWSIPDYDAAKQWLESFELDLPSLVKRLDKVGQYQQPAPKPVPMTEARLAIYTDPPQWALDDRALTYESCQTYGIRWDADHDAWICPIRVPDTNKLMGFQVKGQGHRLFLNRPMGLPKSRTLFGIDAFQGGRMLVVEAPLDAARFKAAGFDGGVATMGAYISDEQVDLMMRADEIILAVDNPRIDTAGKNALRAFHQMARKRGMDFKAFSYGTSNCKDPGDMSNAQIRRGITKAVHSVYGIDRLLEA